MRVGLFDSRNYRPGWFDYVTLDQVVEHLVDPIAVLRDIRTVLRDDGRIVLATPNAASVCARVFGRTWINWHAPYHLHVFSPHSLREAATRAGLAIERVETITSSEWLNYQWIHLLTRRGPGARSPFWTGALHPAIRAMRAVGHTGVDHLITRVLDGLHAGDNVVAVLRNGA